MVRFTPGEVQAIDTVRGDTERSRWVADAAVERSRR
jgi:hypothetical protein